MKTVKWTQFDQPQRYADIEDLQRRIFEKKLNDKNEDDVVIVCQHLPVLTLGRRTKDAHIYESLESLKARDVDVHEIVRGGSVTAHEPGQWVFYPLLNLDAYGLDAMGYVRRLTQWMIQVCQELGVKCSSEPEHPVDHSAGTHLTGVWVGDCKIASIGIRVQNAVTMHGVALNVNNDMALFDSIAPCGIQGLKITSLQQILRTHVDIARVLGLSEATFKALLGVETNHIKIEDLGEGANERGDYGPKTTQETGQQRQRQTQWQGQTQRQTHVVSH